MEFHCVLCNGDSQGLNEWKTARTNDNCNWGGVQLQLIQAKKADTTLDERWNQVEPQVLARNWKPFLFKNQAQTDS